MPLKSKITALNMIYDLRNLLLFQMNMG
jgi:hypothetical protein